MESSHTKCYKKLDWDTEFFGFPVAQIIKLPDSIEELMQCLASMKQEAIRLVYGSGIRDAAGIAAMVNAGGIHVDQKTVYQKKLSGNEASEIIPDSQIVPYDKPKADESMVRLSVEAGIYSRFNTDERIGHQKFVELYTKWIEQSVSHAIAQEVLVCKIDGDICGMITLGEKNGMGNIGLVAVDSSKRGAGIGVALITEATRWFADHGYRDVSVVTQGFNQPACRLYEKCGFSVASSEAFFHFWI